MSPSRIAIALTGMAAAFALAEDWPMWRGDAARSARTPQAIPGTLLGAEPHASGDRIQTLAINGTTVLTDFDIRAEAGGAMRGVVKELRGLQLSGELELKLGQEQEEPG